MTGMGERKKRERINWNTLKKLGHYLAAERWYLLVAVCLAVGVCIYGVVRWMKAL